MSAVLNVAASLPKLDFIDLKTQYRALKPSVDARIQKVLDHGQYIMGPEVVELEQQLAAYVGARHCITCASGTLETTLEMMSWMLAMLATSPWRAYISGAMAR